jgi:hypothetical protein
LLAAVGLQNSRPARVERRDKLAYRYRNSSGGSITSVVSV